MDHRKAEGMDKERLPNALSREERSTGGGRRQKGSTTKFLLFLLFLAAVVVAARAGGISRYLDQHTLKAWIGSYGAWGPIVYIFVYAVTPALFLPGLPVTLAAGILFGPFWGVIYAIFGATAGASVAFLVSRYLARQWVEGQLRSSRWRRLDESVEKHGWKVVAFTRLIPIFPFNLLNYAFGLTKIGFRQYAVTSFICMLPACIAFIVFSSSLLDLVRGKVSVTFIIGMILILLVSFIPLAYKRHKAKHGKDGLI